MTRPQAPVSETAAAKADRYFADQCRRLGPIAPDKPPAPKPRGRAVRAGFDRLSFQRETA